MWVVVVVVVVVDLPVCADGEVGGRANVGWISGTKICEQPASYLLLAVPCAGCGLG